MAEFMTFFDNLVKRFPLHMEILYNKITDWCIYVYKKDCASDYPNAKKDGNDVVLVMEGDGDMELCFAKAYVALKEWLIEFNGGY